MSGYVLTHQGDDNERQRMALLEQFHGPLTIRLLESAGIAPGWHCLEIGAGRGGLTRWLAERVAPTGRVVALDLETNWLEPLQSEIIQVQQADVTSTALPRATFDAVVAQMLLLHVPDPAQVCRRLVDAARPGGQLIIQDADFRPVALQDASELEAAGLAVMNATMESAGVHLALGPELSTLLAAAGARIDLVVSEQSSGDDGRTAASISAITLDRFRERAVAAGASREAIGAAIAALRDPARVFVAPTRWAVRCHVPV